MALRKEQVLAIASLVLGALIWKSGQAAEWRAPSLIVTRQEYVAQKVPAAPVVTTAAPALSLRRWFREPSETQPLPPRELPFPPRPPRALVALPLDPGPDLVRADLLALDGEVVSGVTLQPTASANAAGDAAPVEQAPAHETLADKKKRYEKVYDQVSVANQSEPFFGVLRAPGQDLFKLEQTTDFDGVVVHLLQFQLSKEKLVPPEMVLGNDAMKITGIRLANNLRNTIGRMVRAVPDGEAHVAERLHLIDELLLLARQDGGAFEAAMQEVAKLEKTSVPLVAARAKARVLFAKGDIDGEFEVYRGIADEQGPAAAFRHEGLGNLEARLGLHAAAERDLRRAAELAPTDAGPHASLAAFLKHRGQPYPAAVAARRAFTALGAVADPVDRRRIVPVIVGCLLAVGDLDGARQAAQAAALGGSPDGEALASFLRASIDYSAGKLADAKDSFRVASAGGYGPAAQLGLAACQVRLGEWQDALAGFEAVADQAPLLRHRALAGLALLSLRIGQNDAAISYTDRALEANPQDAYSLYLRARAQEAQGQVSTALESLAGVLRLRDDFVPALAAVADLRMRLFREGDPADQAVNALAAMNYADRAVALSPVPQVPLLELKALAHFRGANLRTAAAAFAQARDAATSEQDRLFAQAGMAVVDYAMDHPDDARPQLERMQEGLGRDQPMRQWAAATLLMIDDHAQKEQLDDHFERDELGSVWLLKRESGVESGIRDHQLVFHGRLTRPSEVSAMRAGAVQKANRFLATGCRMQLGPTHSGEAFAGLRIQIKGSSGGVDFLAQVGARDGAPFWLVREGKEEPEQSPRGGDALGTGVHAFELRVEDRGENQFRLLVVVDGAVVKRKDLVMLRGSDTARELETALVVLGPGGVDVRFDDYHLERRKD